MTPTTPPRANFSFGPSGNAQSLSYMSPVLLKARSERLQNEVQLLEQENSHLQAHSASKTREATEAHVRNHLLSSSLCHKEAEAQALKRDLVLTQQRLAKTEQDKRRLERQSQETHKKLLETAKERDTVVHHTHPLLISPLRRPSPESKPDGPVSSSVPKTPTSSNDHQLDDLMDSFSGLSVSAKKASGADTHTSDKYSWETRYDDLKEYHAAWGHCSVPSKFSDQRLANWVKNQRQAYRQSIMTQARIDRLNELGFAWSLKSTPMKKVKTANVDE